MVNYKYIVASFLGIFLSTSVDAQVSLSPEQVELRDISLSEKVLVTYKGQAVLPTEVMKIVSGVYKYRDDVPKTSKSGTHFSNYSYMFDFKTHSDGTITIKANEDLVEMGSYTLYVHTIYGKATGSINASFSESHPTKPKNRVRSPEFTYGIVLPDYLQGQLISINLNPDVVNTYSWYIDEELHSSGLGETSFRARPEVGTHEISLVVTNPEDEVVSTWSDTIQVSE